MTPEEVTTMLPRLPWWACVRRARRWWQVAAAMATAVQLAHARITALETTLAERTAQLAQHQVDHRLWIESLIDVSDRAKRLARVHRDKVLAWNAERAAARTTAGVAPAAPDHPDEASRPDAATTANGASAR